MVQKGTGLPGGILLCTSWRTPVVQSRLIWKVSALTAVDLSARHKLGTHTLAEGKWTYNEKKNILKKKGQVEYYQIVVLQRKKQTEMGLK